MADINQRNQNILTEKIHPLVMWAMVISITLGVYVRIIGLGKWPLCVDEYLIAKSVGNILQHGLPEFECGGYYNRGILYQYLAAFLQLFPGNKEFYLRIIPVFFNLLALHPLYQIGKKFNQNIACLVVFLFCFSLWEIEFSRFARMYAPFQTLFLYYLLFFLKAVLDKDSRSRNYCYLISVIGIFVHEAGIFLLLLNFIMLILLGNNSKKSDFIVAVIVFLAGYFYLSINFKHLGVTRYIPPDVLDVISQEGKKGKILQPLILFKSMGENFLWILLSSIPISISSIIAFNVLKNKVADYRKKVFLLILILFSILNLFGCIIFATIILLLLGWFQFKDFRLRVFKVSVFASICNFFFWLLYGVTNEAWYDFFDPAKSFYGTKKLFVVLFKYPDIFEKVFFPWISAIPLTALMLFISIGAGFFIWLFKQDRQMTPFTLMFAIMLILVALIGILRTSYSSTRYTFFLYPVMLLLATCSMGSMAQLIIRKTKYQNILLCCFIILFIIFSEDFRLNHLINIDSKEINFRMDYNSALAEHYFPRRDVRSPAEYINRHIGENDVVISTKRDVEYYLSKLDYYYEYLHSVELPGILACNAKKEIWTNANLVYHESELLDIIENRTATVWLIINTDKYLWHKNIEKIISDNYKQYKQYTSIDGFFDVYKITRNI